MNGYNFTERVRRVLARAREEAAALHHEYVGTEHLLLGLLGEKEGVAAAVLARLNIDTDDLRAILLSLLPPGAPDAPTTADLPYTSRGKKVLELAMSEVREFGHSHVGTEHLLLGLLREGKGLAAIACAEMGLTLEDARRETVQLLDKHQLETVQPLGKPERPSQTVPSKAPVRVPRPADRRARRVAWLALLVALTALAVALGK